MKQKIIQSVEIPSGINCSLEKKILKCKSGTAEIAYNASIPRINVSVSNNVITFECEKGNKNDYKKIMSQLAHMRNIFHGLQHPFVYKLEACNVHFPMTLKIEGNILIINNFLGEKTPRTAEILQNVKVEVKGQQLTVSSADREAAGQTAANIEKATRVPNRDRRIFQDGIFITEKPGREV